MKYKLLIAFIVSLITSLLIVLPVESSAATSPNVLEEEITVPRPVETRKTTRLFKGEEEIVSQGLDGKALKTTITDGKNKETTITVMEKPYPKIIEIGSKIPTLDNLPKDLRPGDGGLTSSAKKLRGVLFHKFPEIEAIGGYRECDTAGEHCTGRALDIMVSGEYGVEVMKYLENLHKEKVIDICWNIYQQSIHHSKKGFVPESMSDRGSITQNHYDHIHAFLADDYGTCSTGG